MNFPFQAEPSDKILLYGHDDKVLGILHQNITTAAGERCYGVLAFDCGSNKIVQIPVPWGIIKHDTRSGKYVAAVDHMKLMEAPRFSSSDVTGFDSDFASEIDAVFGLEFPGIESMNDLA